MNQIFSGKLIFPFSVVAIAIVIVLGGIFVWSQANQSLEPQPAPTPQPAVEVPEDWQTYRNDEFGFEVKYPSGYEIQGTGKPGELREGRESSHGYIHIADEASSPDRRILISTPSTRDGSRNPQAASLNDYKTDYDLGSSYIAMIHSQEEFVINGIPTLKQNYSTGRWREDISGQPIFDSTGEYDENRNYRYIFMNDMGETFMLKSGNPAAKPNPSDADKALSVEFEGLLDSIAQTFKFIE